MNTTVTLNNGVAMPLLGYGVYQIPPTECERCVSDAIAAGYRLIDTAQAYANEEAVGNAIRKSGLPRDNFFIVSKIWISNAGYERAKASIAESLRRLQTDYIDLMLIHQPFNDYYGSYRAMEEAYRAGRLRAIGVSNFAPDRLVDLAIFSEISPMVNQVETHVFNQQTLARKTMEQYGCQIMSWAPFAEGRQGFFSHPILADIAARHGRTIAQVALRYLIQLGIVAIPKSTHRERMDENADIWNFSLSPQDMHSLAALDQGRSAFFSHQDPETVAWLARWTPPAS